MTNDDKRDRSEKSAKKSTRFFLLCSGLLLGVITIFGFATQLEIFDAGPHVVFAMIIGVLFTILLGVGLMALAFHSDDSGVDDEQS